MRQFFILVLPCWLFFVIAWSGTAQESLEMGNVFDTALIFSGDDAERALAKLERDMAAVSLETGAQLVLRTESFATGSSAKTLAAEFAAKTLEADRPGALMVHVRADDSIGVAVTKGSGGIPSYVFSTVEKASGAKPSNLESYEYVARAAGEMTAVFQKYYGPEAGKSDPRKRGDKILMAAMVGLVLILTFLFVALSRRRSVAAA